MLPRIHLNPPILRSWANSGCVNTRVDVKCKAERPLAIRFLYSLLEIFFIGGCRQAAAWPKSGQLGQRTSWPCAHFLSVYFFSVYNRSTFLWKGSFMASNFWRRQRHSFIFLLLAFFETTRCRHLPRGSDYCAPGLIKSPSQRSPPPRDDLRCEVAKKKNLACFFFTGFCLQTSWIV